MISRNDVPLIHGLKFRHFQGENDYSHLAAVLTASQNADQVKRFVNTQDIAQAIKNVTNCDPYRDMILVEVEGEVIGYTRGWWLEGENSARLYAQNGFLVPGWRRKGIGQAMLDWMEARLHSIASTHPPEITKFYQVNVTQYQIGTAIMLERSGYQPVRYYFEMVRPTLEDIAEYPLPVGVEIRPVLPGHYRSIWNVLCETSLEQWGHKELTEEDYREWLTSPFFQPDLWQVAWDTASDQVVGHVLTYIHHDENKQFNRKRGYTEEIGVLPAWRWRGVARALISHSLQAQRASGMSESALTVDSENLNEATKLYESCGFQIVKRDTLYRKPI